MMRKSITGVLFALKVLLQKYREGQKLHCVFVHPEKAYDKVRREELWECIRVVQYMRTAIQW